MSETQKVVEIQDSPVESHLTNQLEMMGMVSHIVAAYVSNNTVDVQDLPGFMRNVLRGLCNARSKPSLTAPGLPAVPIEESITSDYIICLEDGKRMKMLKRHLKTVYNMTPDEYRERWGLPINYPMTAPNYAKRRQTIAKSIGLGKNRKKVA